MDKELTRAELAYNNSKENKGYDSIYQKYIKRIIDIVISLMAIPVVIICIIPIAIAVKIEDHGPVFYRSNRIGKDFKQFGMLKIRSMKENSPDLRNEDGSTYNSKTDPRMTKVGKFLRETSLDEIPQFFNVLVGQMSIIGPRAGDIESKDTYKNDEKDKMLVKPGISGYTQAYYRNGLGVREKRLYDAWYSHNVSFLLDVKIFLKTIITVLGHSNLYTN